MTSNRITKERERERKGLSGFRTDIGQICKHIYIYKINGLKFLLILSAYIVDV